MNRQITGATIRFDHLTKSFGNVVAVDEVFFEIHRGEFVTLLGPSGSGKTTILNMVAGFERPTRGNIYLNDAPLVGIPPFKRNIGLVFQNYALFPHMTVFENIAFPLTTRKVSKNDLDSRVKEALALVKLEGYGSRYPKQLSGGQQQRVALARSIIFKPPVLLMDEPLGALDKKLREHMQVEIKHLHEELGLTFIYVTHDQSEALTMSDRIVLLNLGKIEQVGNPDDLYDRPQNRFVAEFIGETNLLEGRVVEFDGSQIGLETPRGIRMKAACNSDFRKEMVNVSLRPEKVILVKSETDLKNVFSAILLDIIYVGEMTKVKVDLEGNGEEIFLKLQNRKGIPKLSKGDMVRVGWDVDDMTLF